MRCQRVHVKFKLQNAVRVAGPDRIFFAVIPQAAEKINHRGHKVPQRSCTEDNESQNRYCISLWQFSLCFPVFSVVSLLNLPMSPTKKNCVDLRFLFGLYFLEVEGGCLDLTSVERGRLPHGAQRSRTRVSDPHGRCRIRGNRESAKN